MTTNYHDKNEAIKKVEEYLRSMGCESEIFIFDTNTATVTLAAQALGVDDARICKTLSFQGQEGCILVQTAGDSKISNSKFKNTFGLKAKMLSPDLVLEYTGHPVGGVCAFNINNPQVRIYCDKSMERFESLYPACGTDNTAIEMTPKEIFKYSKALEWVDVCNIRE